MKDFTHLHLHTEYSLLDGANQVDDVVKAAVKDGQKSIAITDHGNMFGVLEFYNSCKKHNIKPILGCEMYIAKHSHLQKHSRTNGYNHLTLLAQNSDGLRNLMYLTSLSYIEGLSSRPRISTELLYKHHAGIICLSGCLSSKVNELLLEDKEEIAEALVTELRDIFGKDNFWLEIQRNGLQIQNKATEGINRIHVRTGIPIVATNDVHYLRQEDCDFQDTMLCINTGSRKEDTDRFRFDCDTLYFKSTAEMHHMFRDIDKSVHETMAVAERVDCSIDQTQHYFPSTGYADPKQELTARTTQELSKRNLSPEYSSRLQHELQVICSLGFAEYFLVVEDLVRYARSNGIPVGPGRGSAAGCLVSYLLGITSLDPIQHGLLFERFLNSERKSLPDVDIDFCQLNRKNVINYLKDKYGDDKVASIITFNRFGAKKAIRQVAKVLNVPLKESDAMAKKMVADTIKENLSKDPTLSDNARQYPDLFKAAENLEGYVEYAGVHASGVIVSSKPLYEIVPLARIAKGSGVDSSIITQWDLEACEKVGLVKFDILGLETLTSVNTIEKLVKSRHGLELYLSSNKLEELALDDPAVYKVLQSGDTEGVFQCYSDGMKRLLGEMQPDNFNDIVAAIALFRPGPLESGIAESYINRKHGKEKVTYYHSDLEKVMGKTYGTMVYQEQIMQLAAVLAGFSLNEADELRKAVGKKLPELLASIEERFIQGCNALQKVSTEVAKDIWQQIVKFGRYGFNLSHSACYGWLTYYTAYLKVKYPVEFFAANLTQEIGNPDKIKAFVHDARNHGIKILPPCVFEGEADFKVIDDHTIRTGFRAIKGFGSSSVRSVSLPRGYDLLDWLAAQEDIAKTQLVGLASSGALARFSNSRMGIILHADEIIKLSKKERTAPLFGEIETYIPPTEPETIELRLEYERKSLDFYISGHPLDSYTTIIKNLNLKTPSQITEASLVKVPLAGMITDIEIRGVKAGGNKGKKFARVVLEDHTSKIICMVFTHAYGKYNVILEEAYKNAIPVVFTGTIDTAADQPQMLVQHVKRLDEYKLKIDKISFDASNLTENELASLGKLVNDTPGDSYLDIHIGPVSIELESRVSSDILRGLSVYEQKK